MVKSNALVESLSSDSHKSAYKRSRIPIESQVLTVKLGDVDSISVDEPGGVIPVPSFRRIKYKIVKFW